MSFQFPSIILSSNDDKSQLLSTSVWQNKFVSSINSAYMNSSTSNMCHLRLGHPNIHALNLVLHECNIPFNSKSCNFFCSACCMGKAHKLHSPASHTTYSSPLELIYCDLWGPSPNVSTLGFIYYMSFVDAFSKITWIYFLKTKSKAIYIFKLFKAMVELQHGLPIKAFRSDWGGEFRPFNKFLSDLGIIHRVICPHTHHQNGAVERKQRHIVDMDLTLLSQASLPLTY